LLTLKSKDSRLPSQKNGKQEILWWLKICGFFTREQHIQAQEKWLERKYSNSTYNNTWQRLGTTIPFLWTLDKTLGDYIARHNPQRADSFARELLTHIQLITEQPEAYPARPELSEGLRSCAHQCYVISFRPALSV
jgi:hypothetical protein